MIEQVAELVTGRDTAVKEQTRLQNQLSAATDGFFQKHLRRRLARIAKDIAALEREIIARIGTDPELTRRYEILISIPGVGPTTAATLIARMGELGALPDKEIAMLAGLDPMANQSGNHDGKRLIWGGRKPVHRMLYLAAVSASRWNRSLKLFYDRLEEKGKEAKVALVAVARRLIILANTLIAEDRTLAENSARTCLTAEQSSPGFSELASSLRKTALPHQGGGAVASWCLCKSRGQQDEVRQ